MKRLNGYRPTHRNKWLFIQHKVLTLQELSLLEYYADTFDFDKNHERYGLFEEDFSETPTIFSCSPNTIRNWHNTLLKTGFIHKTNKKHMFELACPDRYVSVGKWGGKANHYQKIEKNQPIEQILQSFEINFQSIKQILQPVEKSFKEKVNSKSKTASIAIGSYKDELGLLRSNDEYLKILEDFKPTLLTIEDMKWIDVNTKENAAVPS